MNDLATRAGYVRISANRFAELTTADLVEKALDLVDQDRHSSQTVPLFHESIAVPLLAMSLEIADRARVKVNPDVLANRVSANDRKFLSGFLSFLA
jgi:hypothetical protein